MSLIGMSVTRAEGFHAPGPGSFELPPVFSVGEFGVTKPMLLMVLSGIVVVGLCWAFARNAAIVPGRMQFAGEGVYNFVRNGIARENIGGEHFMKFLPYLFSLFMVILVNNYFGLVPFIQFPTMSRIGYVASLAALTWLVYVGVGIWKHGPLGYLKHATMPGGITGPILILLIPLEFFSNIVVRPFTLSLRLFGNMFAGHLLIILFSTGGAALLLDGNIFYGFVGIISFLMGIAINFLELLVMFLQAYVFTLLTAMYIGEALADEH